MVCFGVVLKRSLRRVRRVRVLLRSCRPLATSLRMRGPSLMVSLRESTLSLAVPMTSLNADVTLLLNGLRYMRVTCRPLYRRPSCMLNMPLTTAATRSVAWLNTLLHTLPRSFVPTLVRSTIACSVPFERPFSDPSALSPTLGANAPSSTRLRNYATLARPDRGVPLYARHPVVPPMFLLALPATSIPVLLPPLGTPCSMLVEVTTTGLVKQLPALVAWSVTNLLCLTSVLMFVYLPLRWKRTMGTPLTTPFLLLIL